MKIFSDLYRTRYIYLLLLFALCSCTSQIPMTQGKLDKKTFNKAPLVVGITANAPPLAFKQGGKLQGAEIDFARRLGVFLDREIHFKELPWKNQIPALESKKIDIIMSGMTITQKRSYRVSFSKPYMRSGQMLLVKMEKANRYSNGIFSLMGNRPAIGTIEHTTGDYLIAKTISKANLKRYSSSKTAVTALLNDKIDVFVYDAPMVCYAAAQSNKHQLTPILKMASEEYLAWAVNRSNSTLLNKLNNFIDAEVNNKNLERTLHQWIPYLFP